MTGTINLIITILIVFQLSSSLSHPQTNSADQTPQTSDNVTALPSIGSIVSSLLVNYDNTTRPGYGGNATVVQVQYRINSIQLSSYADTSKTMRLEFYPEDQGGPAFPDPKLSFSSVLWKLIDTKSVVTDILFRSGVPRYDMLYYYLTVERDPSSYVLKYLGPLFFIAFCSTLTYWVDPSAVPARVGFGLVEYALIHYLRLTSQITLSKTIEFYFRYTTTPSLFLTCGIVLYGFGTSSRVNLVVSNLCVGLLVVWLVGCFGYVLVGYVREVNVGKEKKRDGDKDKSGFMVKEKEVNVGGNVVGHPNTMKSQSMSPKASMDNDDLIRPCAGNDERFLTVQSCSSVVTIGDMKL
ncbi:hypothetical protein HDU76_011538 [Blyttiomyces sp. JEL0837]|nr:hypothetical protein HDU76_011538 [Blyttiomyces sp. JEL0837]